MFDLFKLAVDFVVTGAEIIIRPDARASDRIEQPVAPASVIALSLD
jgi:hypothetical protein